MTSPYHEETSKALQKAKHALQNAKYDLTGGFFLATANRAYYTGYYCMTAMLYTKEVFAKAHQGVRSKFSETFIKTGIFPVAAAGCAIAEDRVQAAGGRAGRGGGWLGLGEFFQDRHRGAGGVDLGRLG